MLQQAIAEAPQEVQDFFKSNNVHHYEDIKSRLLPELINKENNAGLLSRVTSVDFLDMAIIFRVVIRADVDSDELVSFIIDDHALADWGITSTRLLADAVRAAQEHFPFTLSTINDVLGLMGEDPKNTFMVMSNNRRHYGASVMLYSGALLETYARIGQPYYIIPSSIHEVLIVPESLHITVPELKDMCIDVNTSEVAEPDILGDTIYHYGSDGLRIVG